MSQSPVLFDLQYSAFSKKIIKNKKERKVRNGQQLFQMQSSSCGVSSTLATVLMLNWLFPGSYVQLKAVLSVVTESNSV
jgi:hypothetical protein